MTISYLTAYVFHGNRQRLGVGHITLADNENYYSFGSMSDTATKIQPGTTNSIANLVSYDRVVYGDWHLVILPANAQLQTKLEECQKKISELEKKDYSLFNQNCAHAIQSYFENSGYMKKIIDYIIPLTPSELGDKLAEIGQSMINHILKEAEIKKINPNYEAAFGFVQNCISDPKCPSELKTFECTGNIYHDYYFLLKYLAKKHYERAEPIDFYAANFVRALNICPVQPDYTFSEHRIINSIPRTIASALFVAVAVPVIAAALTLAMVASIVIGSVPFALGVLTLPYVIYKVLKTEAAEQNKIDHSHVQTQLSPAKDKDSNKTTYSLPGAKFYRFT